VRLPAARDEPQSTLLPRYYREVIRAPGSGLPFCDLPASDWQEFGEGLRNVRELTKWLSDAAVVLHLGSDTLNPFSVPGVSLQRELANFIELGFTPEHAWAAATSGNASGLPDVGLGRVEVGAAADLLIFCEDPTRDLSALPSLEAVIADGRLYEKSVLDEALRRHMGFASSWL